MRKAWTVAAIVFLNTVLLFVVANIVAAFLVASGRDGPGAAPAGEAWLIDAYGFDVLRRGYPGWRDDDLRALLTETGSWPQVFEPYTMFRPQPRADRYITVDPAGFRPSPGQQGRPAAAWHDLWQRRAPADAATDLFVFGGSTTMGAGVPDGATIPAHLQVLADAQCTQPVRMFNFGRGFYYSTQERILFEQLLLAGARPDVAVFIDGLNDFYFPVDVPRYSDRFATLIEEANRPLVRAEQEREPFGDALVAAIDALPLVRLWRRHSPFVVADAAAAAFDPAGQSHDDALNVVTRMHTNRRMIDALAKLFGVSPLFVWQPVPTYGYDLAHMNVAQAGKLEFGRHALSGLGYALQAAARSAPSGRSAAAELWLGDLQRGRAENLYVDSVHYTEAFSRDIAAAIFTRLVADGALPCAAEPAR